MNYDFYLHNFNIPTFFFSFALTKTTTLTHFCFKKCEYFNFVLDIHIILDERKKGFISRFQNILEKFKTFRAFDNFLRKRTIQISEDYNRSVHQFFAKSFSSLISHKLITDVSCDTYIGIHRHKVRSVQTSYTVLIQGKSGQSGLCGQCGPPHFFQAWQLHFFWFYETNNMFGTVSTQWVNRQSVCYVCADVNYVLLFNNFAIFFKRTKFLAVKFFDFLMKPSLFMTLTQQYFSAVIFIC